MGGINLYQYAPNPVGWVDPLGWLHRPYIRKSTRKAVEDKARVVKGRFLDANTGKPIEGGKRRPWSRAEGKYHLGHKPGHEHWRMVAEAEAKGLSQREFNDLMNNPDFYHIEDPMENQSHRHEDKSKGNQLDIISDADSPACIN
ncbi:GH-E family nuclease [Oligella urethralis]|uniref:GH-E family nuclease n=2 Tax=Oligella urethralis TaxID=90245 RepID=UPI0009E54E54|nr:GH-E family nuclease [Oligella urethralis]